MTKPIYAVGDIHGQLDELDRILDLIQRDGGDEAQIVFIGDFIDRGPDSRGVLDRLIDGQAQGCNWITLMGNHDRMFSWFMEETPRHDHYLPVGLYWLHPRLGGEETLQSYGVRFAPNDRQTYVHDMAKQAVPQAHVDFLRSCRLSFQTDDVFFAHAGIRPKLKLDRQKEHDLLWIRQEFHKYTRPHPKLIVHGHTPVDQATHYGNRVNIDTGAGYGKQISGIVLEGNDVWLLTDHGRQVLVPQTA